MALDDQQAACVAALQVSSPNASRSAHSPATLRSGRNLAIMLQEAYVNAEQRRSTMFATLNQVRHRLEAIGAQVCHAFRFLSGTYGGACLHKCMQP